MRGDDEQSGHPFSYLSPALDVSYRIFRSLRGMRWRGGTETVRRRASRESDLITSSGWSSYVVRISLDG